MLSVKVDRINAEITRLQLSELGIIDKDHKILAEDCFIFIPLLRPPNNTESRTIMDLGGETVKHPEAIPRQRFYEPMKDIILNLDIPEDRVALIPKKWEMLGDILILKMDDCLLDYRAHIAETYAEVLGAKTVLRDVSGVDGKYREPNMELLFGVDTKTVHLENGIRYMLDTSKLMFSSGNIDERIRMASISGPEETVVDMFAGIGYFSLPIAVHSKPLKVLAYEINPTAYKYLEKNIALNEVNEIIVPHLANCKGATEGVADRVIMGYVGTTHEYLGKAIRILKGRGTIHYHETCPNDLLPGRPTERLMQAADGEGRKAEILSLKKIKSYAPGVSHLVLDVKIS